MLAGCILALVMGGSSVLTLVESDIVRLKTREIHISDVLNLEALEPEARESISGMVIGVVPADKRRIDISRRELATLVRRRVPIFSNLHVGEPTRRIRIESASHTLPVLFSAADSTYVGYSCYTSMRALQRDDILSLENLNLTQCEGPASSVGLRYDRRAGVVRANTRIAANTYLGRLSVPKTSAVDTGDELRLAVSIGPIRVEKIVWALQPAQGAGAIFVKDRDNNILRVPIIGHQMVDVNERGER